MLIKNILSLFHQGKALKHSETWADRGLLANALSAILLAAGGVAQSLGWINVDIGSDNAQIIGMGLATLWTTANLVLHTITSKDVGLPATEPESVPEPKQPNADAVPDKIKADVKSEPVKAVKPAKPDDIYFG